MNHSDIEDDPEPYESSGDECSESEKKKTRRRTSKRTAKKPRKSLDISGSSDSEREKSKPKSKNGINKKTKASPSKIQTSQNSVLKKTGREAKVSYSKNYSVGSFVINKKDAKVGDPNKHPWIWKIDGKSLLQKYEAIEHEGKIRHKNTSIYTGWSPLDSDEYAPVTVDSIQQSPGEIIVELHWDELKSIVREDSE
ncbi:hypothetical protein WA026_016421 [Henosepilachna vigintioctopunctata]|uniref:Uncharacterized protein n=1 Tax=Henosepilachna vigintioctopunctata TaxID=420089 RepID=A0AAW1UFS4_9CUCU